MPSRYLRLAKPHTRRTPHRMPARTATAAFIIAALAAAAAPAASAATQHATATTAAHPAAAPAAPNAGVQVMYNGHVTSYTTLSHTLGNTFCDDFAGHGKLTCYSTQRAMETYLLAHGGYAPQEAARIAHTIGVTSYPAERTAAPRTTAGPDTTMTADHCYPGAIVQLWSKANEKGSLANIYCDYTNLATIGWAGKARSADIVQLFETELIYAGINYAKISLELNIAQARHDVVMAFSEKLGT